jgi:hypothetical protein
MDSKEPNNDYLSLGLFVKKEDVPKIQRKINLMYKYVCAERKIPYQIIDGFFKLLHEEKDLIQQKYHEETILIADKAASYFEKQKGYDFNGKSKVLLFTPPDQKGKNFYSYSLNEMCCDALHTYYSKRKQHNKGNAIRILYKRIDEYSKLHFSKKYLKELTHYKKTIIATFLVNELGFINPYLENPTNPLLNDKGKDDTKIVNPRIKK